MKTIRNMIHIFLLFAIVTTFQPASAELVGAGSVVAVPTDVFYGDTGTIGTVRVSVLRGFEMPPVFGLYVTTTEDITGKFTDCQLLLSETNAFRFEKSQAFIDVNFDKSPSVCPMDVGITAGNDLVVCATVLLVQNGEYVDFSHEVCSGLNPQLP